jgi:ADP-ribose pyrophosphatase YjhB (NUDIX family)
MTITTNDLKQALYLIADEMRGMATIGDHFAENIYEVERAHRMMGLAAKIAALAEEKTQADVQAVFERRPWLRVSPAIGVEAAIFNDAGEILLIQRRDNAHWALPGGIAEIGRTLAESVVLELWEEAGLRGRVERLLGVFDGRLWGSPSKVHLTAHVFLMRCDDLTPSPGLETLDAQFFARDRLPDTLHPGHDRRVPVCFEAWESGAAYVDSADAREMDLPPFQRNTAP